MSQKILRLAPGRGMFMADGIHLVNPEKPVNYLPDTYQPTPKILSALRANILIDVNGNIVESEKPTAAKDVKPDAPKIEDAKVEDPAAADKPAEVDEPAADADAAKETTAKTKRK
ncbi:hypothetical protein D3C85_452560 [compost metagenome]